MTLSLSARRIFSLLAAFTFVTGCVPINRVATPTPLELAQPEYRVEIEPPPGRPMTMSIGDAVIRYGSSRLIVECCPTLLGQTVPLNGWQKTFVHAEGDGYSNRQFYRGDVGLVIDKDLNLLRWIQIGGLRRWRQGTMRGAPLFKLVREYNSHWWLRYGGESEGTYRFEIVEKPNDNQSEVIQPVLISESKFLEGFFVRSVGIQGLRPDHRGTIEYQTLEPTI